MSDTCKRRGTEVLTQDVFKDAPQEANVAVVNYDSTLHFGIKGSNFRFAYNAGQYRGYEKVGESVLNSKYKPEQSIRRIDT